MNKFIWIDGKIFPEDQAKISRTDLGLIRGYGVFDFFRTYKKTPFHLLDHFHRFEKSAQLLDLQLPYSLEIIEKGIDELIDCFDKENIGIKFYLTGGESSDAFTLSNDPSFWMIAQEINPQPLDYALNLKTISHQREWPEAKTTNYQLATYFAKKYRQQGYQDIIYVDKEQNLLESSTSNLFFIKKNTIYTPSSNILEGITRNIVLELAKPYFSIELRPISLSELKEMQECFITSTTKEICPVNLVDDHKMESSQFDSKTSFLKNLFQDYTLKFHHSFKIDSTRGCKITHSVF